MGVHLRLLTSFFEIVRILKEHGDYSFIVDRLMTANPEMEERTAKKMAEPLFWKMNFEVVLGIIERITTSLCSRNVLKVLGDVCDEINTPASALIKQNANMWIGKRLCYDELKNLVSDKNYVVQWVSKYLVASYCRMHIISREDRNHLESLGFKKHVLLPVNK